MLTEACVMFFSPSRAVSAIWGMNIWPRRLEPAAVAYLPDGERK